MPRAYLLVRALTVVMGQRPNVCMPPAKTSSPVLRPAHSG
ncbi:MAG: hypothetical protein JWO02_4199 [Solirubrobacterales bacterium]|nr:hypothetical protein [Solirubrobacterales bacterium]